MFRHFPAGGSIWKCTETEEFSRKRAVFSLDRHRAALSGAGTAQGLIAKRPSGLLGAGNAQELAPQGTLGAGTPAYPLEVRPEVTLLVTSTLLRAHWQLRGDGVVRLGTAVLC